MTGQNNDSHAPKFGPQDSIPYLDNEAGRVFLSSKGMVKHFETSFEPIFLNTFKSLGKISPESLSASSAAYLMPVQLDWLYMIEHLPTGYLYVLDALNPHYSYPVYDLSESPQDPSNIEIANAGEWAEASIDSPGTRVGGLPYGYDETRWPHHRGKPLLFVAQYLLDSSDYAYVFASESYPAYGSDNGTACVLVQDGPIPESIEVKSIGKTGQAPSIHPRRAFKPACRRSEHPQAPRWVDSDTTPENALYSFLGQFGDSMDRNGTEHSGFPFQMAGEMYVFMDRETKAGIVLRQSQ